MNTIKRILAVFISAAVIAASLAACSNSSSASYTEDELRKMNADELYEIFIQNGLQIDDNLKAALTEEQLAEFIKSEFDLLIEGVTARSYTGYLKMANDIKNIYETITKK